MSGTHPQCIELIAHPSTPCNAVERLEVQFQLEPPGTYAFRYFLQGDLERLRIPSKTGGGRVDELWKRTCFEAFIQSEPVAYFELNFSPTQQWAVYHFDGYRQGMAPVELARAPEITQQRSSRRFELQATLHLAAGLRSRLALCAVVEGEDGTLSYWAARHPAGKPDFHHPDGFVLEL